MKFATLQYNPLFPADISFHIYYHHMVKIKKETANIWEYNVGNKGNIANFVCM